MAKEGSQPDGTPELNRVEVAMANLRKQHLWGSISDEEFKHDFESLERQRKMLQAKQQLLHTPNLDRAATLLNDLAALWEHPGVSDGQRRELVREVFEEVRLHGREITAVTPKPTYAPLFAYSLCNNAHMVQVGVSGFEPPTSWSQTMRAKPGCATPRFAAASLLRHAGLKPSSGRRLTSLSV